MARAGDVLVNPVTKERIVFRQTAADTGGELLQLELEWPPDGFLAAAHAHPHQEERFEILDGSAWFRVRGWRSLLRAGEELTVPAGTPHDWGPGEAGVRALVELRPAQRAEEIFETLAALAEQGRLNRRGWPKSPLLAAVLADEWRDDAVGAFPPLAVQRAFRSLLAPLGRRRGYSVGSSGSG